MTTTEYLMHDTGDRVVVRPSWTNNDAIGFLVLYLDAMDPDTPAEQAMIEGYQATAGIEPYEFDVKDFTLDEGHNETLVLRSLRYPEDEPYKEVSRCIAGDGATVVMFRAAMTAVIRDGQLVWLARLD